MTIETDILVPLTTEFIRLWTDFGFKRVFGSKEHAGILKQFLNAVFEGEFKVETVEFRNVEIQPSTEEGKSVRYDIYCTTDTGHHFILEMQKEDSINFSDRIVFYVSRAVVSQGMRGWEYGLQPVYCVVVADFKLSHIQSGLKKDIALRTHDTHEMYNDKFRILFLSLPEVPREWEDCDTELKRLMYLIKNMDKLTRDSAPYRSGKYKEIFNAAKTSDLTKEEMIAYSDSYLKDIDQKNVVRFAEIKAEEKGMQKGIEKGRLDTLWEMAKNLLKAGVDMSIVAATTSLSMDDLKGIQASL